MTVRVLIADDHSVVRAGLRVLIEAEPDLHVAGEATDAESTVSEVQRVAPDVVVLDLDMPGATGSSVVEAIGRELPSAGTVVLSMHASPGHVRDACRHGARGYVPKHCADTDLLDAIRAVARGGTYIHSVISARLASDAGDSLSPREREVVALLARGHTNAEIGARLGISVRTIEAHRSHAMQKLGHTTRAELVAYALEQGLLSGDVPR